MLESLEKMLARGQDNALLRFGLGKGYLDAGEPARAIEHLARCVEFDPAYSAAWKLLGKALAAGNRPEAALEAYRQGISTANAKGDVQAAKEMTVFAKRLEKQLAGS